MSQGTGFRDGTHTVVPEAIAGVPAPSAHEFVFRRALGSGQESTTTSSSKGLLASQTLLSSPTPSPSSGRHGISQTLLEWVFAVIALGLLTILVIWRCTYIRYRNRNIQSSILPSSRGAGPRPALRPRSYAHSLRNPQPAHIRNSQDLTSGSTFNRHTRALVLSPSFLHTGLMPLVDGRGVQINAPDATQPRVRGHRVSGLDVDEGGRRTGSGVDESGDEDGDVAPAEELPAYEMGKGPPGYQVAIGHTARPYVVEIGLPERIADHSLQNLQELPVVDPLSPRPNYASSSLGSHPQSREPGIPPPLSPEPTSQGHPPPHLS